MIWNAKEKLLLVSFIVSRRLPNWCLVSYQLIDKMMLYWKCAKEKDEVHDLYLIVNFMIRKLRKFYRGFLFLEAKIPANWSDKDSLHLDDHRRERWICPSLAAGRQRDSLVNVSEQEIWREVERKSVQLMPLHSSVSMKIFCGWKRRIPSQQLPSFMFLSWSWVLWKISYKHWYDATCSFFSVACIFSSKVSPLLAEFSTYLWIKFDGLSV